MGSEQGQIRSEGGGRELVGGALVTVRGGRRWCRLVIVSCPCCPLVPCCCSFVVVRSFSSFVCVRRSCPSFVCIASLAPGVTHLGRGEVNGLAVDCHWVGGQ